MGATICNSAKVNVCFVYLTVSSDVKAGDTILIHAAAGGVGSIVCQWAKHLGATVIGTVGSDEKADYPPPIRRGVEESLEFLADDELLEVTPESLRLRKLEQDGDSFPRNLLLQTLLPSHSRLGRGVLANMI